MLSFLLQVLGCLALVWSVAVVLVQAVGISLINRLYSAVSPKPTVPALPKGDIPHITVIRPAKGLEPGLYECLASTFQQSYPRDKLTVYFCVSSTSDPAYPVIQKLVKDFSSFDTRVFVESEDPLLQGSAANRLGPNPKIRNVSHAYREVKGDIIWAIDCNIWVGRDVGGRMVDKLCGYGQYGARVTPYKFIHQLPIVVDTVSSMTHVNAQGQALLSGDAVTGSEDARSDVGVPSSFLTRSLQHGGGRLEEMFMATSHAKFYGAINVASVAPCIVGKSNMFRKSHIELATDPSRNPMLTGSAATLPSGMDHFSVYLCEDHIIGELLWKTQLPGYKNHGLVADLAIQPMAGMSVSAYIARRVRWLRARKWTVLAATLVEHGIECFVCCFYFSFGLTTVPVVREFLSIPGTWESLGICWLITVTTWMLVDRAFFNKLHAGQSMNVDDETPRFARGTSRGGAERRHFGEWFLAWLGRELLALPIWTWAIFLGTSVNWRGERFRVRSDMMVVAMDEPDSPASPIPISASPAPHDTASQARSVYENDMGIGSGLQNNGVPMTRKKTR